MTQSRNGRAATWRGERRYARRWKGVSEEAGGSDGGREGEDEGSWELGPGGARTHHHHPHSELCRTRDCLTAEAVRSVASIKVGGGHVAARKLLFLGAIHRPEPTGAAAVSTRPDPGDPRLGATVPPTRVIGRIRLVRYPRPGRVRPFPTMALSEINDGQQPVLVLTRRGLKRVVIAVGILIAASIFFVRPGASPSHEDRLNARKLPLILVQAAASSEEGGHEVFRAPNPHAVSGEQGSYTATVVMGRMEKEADDMKWVHDKLVNITDSHIYVVDNPDSPLLHLDKNHGREARVYLEYIVANYDNLSDVTFFWHVAEKVWHNNILLDWDSVKSINRMDRGNIMREGYVASRCDAWPGCPAWIKFNPSQAEHQLDPHRLADMFNPKLFGELFPEETEFPPYFAGTCCSQFAVSRDAIRNRPIELYQRLLNFVTNYWSDQHAGMVFELLWPYIFLSKGTNCPTMQDCYCKTYNLCLEDPQEIRELEEWNGWRGRRDELSWQVTYVQDKFDEKKKAAAAYGMSLDKIEDDKEYGPEMARVRGEFARMRTKVKTMQDSLVKYWKLSDPPTYCAASPDTMRLEQICGLLDRGGPEPSSLLGGQIAAIQRVAVPFCLVSLYACNSRLFETNTCKDSPALRLLFPALVGPSQSQPPVELSPLCPRRLARPTSCNGTTIRQGVGQTPHAPDLDPQGEPWGSTVSIEDRVKHDTMACAFTDDSGPCLRPAHSTSACWPPFEGPCGSPLVSLIKARGRAPSTNVCPRCTALGPVTDTVVPLPVFDDQAALRCMVLYETLRFDEVLDPERLRHALERLMRIGGWRKLGARLRTSLEDKDKLEYHIPIAYDEQRPGFIYSHEEHDMPIAEHPVAARIPNRTAQPTVHNESRAFISLARRENGPKKLDDYLYSDEPQLSLHIVSFRDATLVSLSWSHTFTDAMGMSAVFKAWQLVLEGREREVPPVCNFATDPLDALGISPSEPHVHAGRRLEGLNFILFGLRFVFNLLWHRYTQRIVYLPASTIRTAKETANQELYGSDTKLQVSSGDILCALLTRLTIRHMAPSSPRQVVMYNAMDIRPSLATSLLPPSAGVFLGNAVQGALTFTPARFILGMPLSAVAAGMRQAIVRQREPAQVDALAGLLREASEQNRPPLFGDSDARMVVFTNWAKAGFYAVDFGAAAVGKGRREGPVCPSFVSCIVEAKSLLESWIILGQDHTGGFWVEGNMASASWEGVQEIKKRGRARVAPKRFPHKHYLSTRHLHTALPRIATQANALNTASGATTPAASGSTAGSRQPSRERSGASTPTKSTPNAAVDNTPPDSGKLRQFLSILKKFIGVNDMAAQRFSLPAQLMEPIPNLEYWQYLDRPEAFTSMADSDDALGRMLGVLRFWFTKDLKYVKGKPCKPYNSVLGEFFRCNWEVDTDLAPLAGTKPSDTQAASEEQPLTVSFLTEQTSHHPPVSAYYIDCPEKGLSARGFDQLSAQFTGTSIKVAPGQYNRGIFVSLDKHGEKYHLTHPIAYLGGLLRGSLSVSVADSCFVYCPQSKLKAILYYPSEGWVGRAQNKVQGVIFQYDPKNDKYSRLKDVPDELVVARIDGCWHEQIFFTLGSKPFEKAPAEKKVQIIDLRPLYPVDKIVPPEDQQLENESRRFWTAVTEAILSKQYGAATTAKVDIEERQRQKAKEREARNATWQPRFFTEPLGPDGQPELTADGRDTLNRLHAKEWALTPSKELAS
ncbi:hypothetical protein FH972_026183 [Carpinus fangiana]|uniref:Uncharacterized protein n=1 Tax=Carpinus fangiana TaxID=176857 RepID=A0A5N6L380_9ROSI|nr:hypothetical protein FH972_026183 [Carpinus fangiana]